MIPTFGLFIKTGIIFAALAVANFSMAQNNEVKTVVSEGIGRDAAEAAQNAAQNALKNVVGSFIDSKTELEKKVQIQDGVKQQSKNIKTDIKEYSQGVIKSFEILKVGNSDGFVSVTAKVTVKIDDFKVYIKKLAEVEVDVDEGLFAQLKTQSIQNKNSSALIYEKILSPLIKGDGIDFSVSTPKPLSQMGLNGVDLSAYLQANSGRSIIGLIVEVKSKEGFDENATKILESIAKKKISLGSLTESQYSWELGQKAHIPPAFNYQTDFSVTLLGSDPGSKTTDPKSVTAYLIQDSKTEFSKITNWTACLMGANDCQPSNGGGETLSRGHPTPMQSLQLDIISKDGKSIQRELVNEKNPIQHSPRFSQSKRMLALGNYSEFYTTYWSLVGGDYSGGHSLLLVRDTNKFIVLVAVNDDAMKNAKSIALKLVD